MFQLGDTSKKFLIVVNAMKRIKHVNGNESAGGGVQNGQQNGIGWSRKSSEIVTFKPNPKRQKGANHVQIWKRVFPARATNSKRRD